MIKLHPILLRIFRHIGYLLLSISTSYILAMIMSIPAIFIINKGLSYSPLADMFIQIVAWFYLPATISALALVNLRGLTIPNAIIVLPYTVYPLMFLYTATNHVEGAMSISLYCIVAVLPPPLLALAIARVCAKTKKGTESESGSDLNQSSVRLQARSLRPVK